MTNTEETKEEPEQLRKMFIGGLDYGTTDDSLKEYYEQWGTVVDVVVMKDPKTRRSRGFGFITYSEASMVDDAMSHRPHKIDGRQVEPKRAVPRDLCGKGEANVRKLFIGGIGKTVKKEDLEEYFGKFGTLTDCAIVVTKDTGEPRGFGFVEYDDVDSADKVILIRDHEIKGRRVEIKKAIARDDINKNDGKGDRGRGRGGFRDGRGGGGGDFRNGQGNFGGGWNNQGGNWGPNNSSPWSNQPPQMSGNWGGNQAWGNNPCWGNNQNGYPQGFNNMGMGMGNMGGGMGGNMGSGMGNMGGGMGNMGGGGGGGGGGMGGGMNMGMGMGMGNMGGNMGNNMGSGIGGGMSGMGCGMNSGMGGMLSGMGGGGGGVNNAPNNNMYGGGNMGGGMGFNNNYGGGSSGGGPMRGNYGSSSNRPTPYSTSGGGMNDRRGGGGGQYSGFNADKGAVRRDGKKPIRS